MAEHGSRSRPTGGEGAPAPAGRPSRRATERLETRFAAELGLTRAAWDDALRRSDERWRQDDAVGVVETLEDQRRLLQLLEDRLCSVVSSAAVEREAEGVVAASSAASSPPLPASDGAPSRPAVARHGAPTGEAARGRSRVPALAGAGAAVALTMIALAVGVALGLGAPPVPEVAAPVDDRAVTPAPSSGGDLDHAVAVADRHAVSSVDLNAVSTNWHQVLRALDLAAVAAEPDQGDAGGPASDDDAGSDAGAGEPARAGGAAGAPQEPEPQGEQAAGEAPDPDREEGGSDEEGRSDQDEPDRPGDPGLGDLGDLDDLGQDEETSLPGVEVSGAGRDTGQDELP